MILRIVAPWIVGLCALAPPSLCLAEESSAASPTGSAAGPQSKEIVIEARACEVTAWKETSHPISFEPARSAIIICDVWDKHWCASASRRCGEIARRIAPLVDLARSAGVKIVHCPSDTMDFYTDSPARRRILEAPPAKPPVPFTGWRRLDALREGELPIDDADGGCDCVPMCANYKAWTREHPAIAVERGDVVSQSGEEVFNYLTAERVNTIIYVGVHLNKCVLGRSFGIRQMTDEGFRTMLVRDLTDTMYNPRSRPFVVHERGTELMIEHVEKHWAPTVTCDELTKAFAGAEPKR
jgi:nicotinamidase-related amidase